MKQIKLNSLEGDSSSLTLTDEKKTKIKTLFPIAFSKVNDKSKEFGKTHCKHCCQFLCCNISTTALRAFRTGYNSRIEIS